MRPWDVIAQCQKVLADYIVPGGISEKQALSELLRILDDQDLIVAQRAEDVQ